MCQDLMPTTSYTGVAFDAALVADVSDAELDGLGMPSDCHVEHGADTCPAYQFIWHLVNGSRYKNTLWVSSMSASKCGRWWRGLKVWDVCRGQGWQWENGWLVFHTGIQLAMVHWHTVQSVFGGQALTLQWPDTNTHTYLQTQIHRDRNVPMWLCRHFAMLHLDTQCTCMESTHTHKDKIQIQTHKVHTH